MCFYLFVVVVALVVPFQLWVSGPFIFHPRTVRRTMGILLSITLSMVPSRHLISLFHHFIMMSSIML